MTTRITVHAEEILDPGYRRAYPSAEAEAPPSPLLRARPGQRLHARARPTRRTLAEADLIRLLREHGVGRPSTYADALTGLRRHRYVADRDGGLIVTERGRLALGWLREHYPGLFDPAFTAEMERLLDALAAGEMTYQAVVGTVWRRLNVEEA